MEQGDALRFPVDVLVLKHAQALYGVDEEVVTRASLPRRDLPHVGRYTTFRAPSGIDAENILLIGVASIRTFDYGDIRALAHRALQGAAIEYSDARTMAFTLHGVGFGLDENGALEAEVGGILDALADGDYPKHLEKITIIEVDAGRAARLQERLAALLAGYTSAGRPGRLSARERNRAGRHGWAAQPHAFIAMPFAGEYDDVFHYGIKQAVNSAGLLCERVDSSSFTGDVLDRMKKLIREAQIVVADLSEANPNVYLEVGYAWASEVPTVLLCKDADHLKFDVRGQRCLIYASIRHLEEQLAVELSQLPIG